jgi:hypothetical protein
MPLPVFFLAARMAIFQLIRYFLPVFRYGAARAGQLA